MDIVKPMLAVKAPRVLTQYPYVVSRKYDGVRCIIKDGVALSRTLKPIPNKYIQSIFNSAKFHGLDGELIVGMPNSNNTMQVTVSGVMSVDGEPDFKFYVFDIWTEPSISYKTRHAMLCNRFEKINHERVVLLDYTLVKDEFELIEYENIAVRDGYEGVILRSPDSLYKYGRSTVKENYLLKLKRFSDSEAVVVEFEELMHNDNEAVVNALGLTERSSHKGNKRGAGVLGAFVCQDINTGVKFSIGTGFTAEQRKEFWDNRWNLLGKMVKYKFFEVGVKKAPRFPVFLGFRSENDL